MSVFTLTRRSFVRTLGLLGLAAPLVAIVGCGDDDKGAVFRDDEQFVAYKLSRHGRKSCRACRLHARYKLFSSAAVADAHRAHSGCTCRIKTVRIPQDEAQRYFAEFPYYDRRTGIG